MRKTIFALMVILASSGNAVLARKTVYDATIIRTAHGIPHVTAKNWAGIGYGIAYSYAQDNLCMLAEEFVTVAGERTLHFGPKAMAAPGFEPMDNLSSDIFFRAIINLPSLRRGASRVNPDTIQARAGYVAGYNRLLRDLGSDKVPVACRGKTWVRPITVDDMLRLGEKQALLAGSLALAPAIVAAAPPTAKQTTGSNSIALPEDHPTGFGSNGWAFGAETTANGRGLVVGNPHFPWNGASRFYEMHITIPGVIDVMGVGLGGAPLPTLGFNKDIAWTHTVTAARHFTVFELKLDPKDATAYLVDGKSEKMKRISVAVPMPDGAAPEVRTLYTTRFGSVVALPASGLGWTAERAFAARDANAGNQRLLDTWISIGKARSVGDVRKAVETTLGIPWVNTIVADRNGDVLLADVTAVPNISSTKIKACATPFSALAAGRIILLDGSRSACDWDRAKGTPIAGLMPASDQAVFARRDYVANSNDSYWLTNPKTPARPLSPILGGAQSERSLRTRSGLIEIDRRLTGQDGLPGTKIDPASARTMAFANKSLAAEMAVDPIVSLCRDQTDLAVACTVLEKWDRRFDLDSRGAALFATFWDNAAKIPGLWAVKFDVADPVHTPRDIVTTGEAGYKLLTALRTSVEKLAKDGIALDARWGDVQFAIRGSDHIPIHGATGALGVLNVQMSDPVPGGLVPRHGSSYVQVVTFDDTGPVADAVLSYSQSTDPASPWFADQTRAYSAKRWHRLPFTPAEIAADGASNPIRINE